LVQDRYEPRYFQPKPLPFQPLSREAPGAFQELAANIQAPLPLIGGALLSAMAYSCHKRILARRGPGLVSPVTLYLLTIAESGERKSVIDALVTRSIRELEAKALVRFKKSKIVLGVQEQIYAAKRSMLLSALREYLRNDEPNP
jgi:hypothetical protein